MHAYEYKITDELMIKLSQAFQKKVLEVYETQLFKLSNSIFAFSVEKVATKLNLKAFHKLLENETIIFSKLNIEFNPNITLVTSGYSLDDSSKKFNESKLCLESALKDRSDIKYYSKELHHSQETKKKNLQIAYYIKKAIQNNEVIIHYQPIFNNYQKKIEKYESLMRLKNKDNLIFPNNFIQISKDIKKYKELTKILIQKSFEYFKDKDYEFSINLTLEDIENKDLVFYLKKMIKEYDIGKKLVLEIVESESITNYDNFIKFIIEMKSYDCKIAIDDFGSGYSNFEYIINFSEYIDYIKIDGSLIKGIQDNRKAQFLVGTIKFLCDNLNIRTIAEYVEDEETFEFIDSMGISYSQGYHIGKPNEHIEIEK